MQNAQAAYATPAAAGAVESRDNGDDQHIKDDSTLETRTPAPAPTRLSATARRARCAPALSPDARAVADRVRRIGQGCLRFPAHQPCPARAIHPSHVALLRTAAARRHRLLRACPSACPQGPPTPAA
jgi:hypothetical protein